MGLLQGFNVADPMNVNVRRNRMTSASATFSKTVEGVRSFYQIEQIALEALLPNFVPSDLVISG